MRLGPAPLLVLLLSPSAPAVQCTFWVNSTADIPEATLENVVCETAPGNGVCTLRAAIMSANAADMNCLVKVPSGTFIITRPPGDPYDDGTGDLDLRSSMQILGAGAGRTVIDANQLDRHFKIRGDIAVTIDGVTLTGGRAPGGAGSILFDGASLTLTNSVLQDDRSTPDEYGFSYGGCVATSGFSGPLVIQNTAFADCHAEFVGSAASWGGAIYARSELSLVSSLVATSTAKYGGGIYVYGPSGPTLLRDDLIWQNGAYATGGGLVCEGPVAPKIVNTTISGNVSYGDGGGVAGEGGADFSNVTIAGNIADVDLVGGGAGGGIAWTGAAGMPSFTNSIVAGNVEGLPAGPTDVLVPGDCAGTLVSGGWNLFSVKNCTVLGPVTVGDPKLGPLQWNGGVWDTHGLLQDSPAIDAGNPSGCTDHLGAPLDRDARRVHRPVGARCDAGAFERSPSGDANGDGIVDVLDVFYLINTLFAGGPVPLGWPDVNGDVSLDVKDVFFLINALFAGGPAPVEPP